MEMSSINTAVQYYKDVPLRQIARSDYHVMKARRFTLNGTNQNVWIPNRYLEEDGTIKPLADIDFVFHRSKQKFYLAGISHLYPLSKQQKGVVKAMEAQAERESVRSHFVRCMDPLYSSCRIDKATLNSLYAFIVLHNGFVPYVMNDDFEGFAFGITKRHTDEARDEFLWKHGRTLPGRTLYHYSHLNFVLCVIGAQTSSGENRYLVTIRPI